MAKKGKHRPRRHRPVATMRPPASPAAPAASPSTPAERPPVVLRPPRPAGPALPTDYTYVKQDLRRIALLSAGAFAILGLLSLVIR